MPESTRKSEPAKTPKASKEKETSINEAMEYCLNAATKACGEAHAHDLVKALLDILPTITDPVQAYRAAYRAIVDMGTEYQKAMNMVMPKDKDGADGLPF